MNPSLSLREVIQFCLQHQIPFASYSLPESTELYSLFGKTSSLDLEAACEQGTTGFICSPFSSRSKASPYFIQGEMIRGLEIPGDLISRLSSFAEPLDKSLTIPHVLDQRDYLKLLSKTIQHINSGAVDKVVISRSMSRDRDENGDVFALFDQLNTTYPNAFVSLWFHPEQGIWIGASPELLLAHEKGNYQTVALAGTKAYSGPESLHDWGIKEQEEQEVVDQYIQDAFELAQLEKIERNGPFGVRSAQLVHLKTTFSATGPPDRYPVLLQALHPTPALCGWPKEAAFEYIEENEGYDREYYGGYLGPVNVNGLTATYVNIRCMKIVGSKYHLFAGGGITGKSTSDQEWRETEMKSRTLLDVIESR